MISDVEKNKQISEIKIEPDEFCDSNSTQTEETKSTCSTSNGKFYINCKNLIFVKYYKIF